MYKILTVILSTFFFAIPLYALNTFTYRIGGSALRSGDKNMMSKHDFIICNRGHFDDIDGNTWGALKAINPKIKILIYQGARDVRKDSDTWTDSQLNTVARWTVNGYGDRNHTQGILSTKKHLMLRDSYLNPIYNSSWPGQPMDMGNQEYIDYFIEATKNDLVCSNWSSSKKTLCTPDRAWNADGFFLDVDKGARTSLIEGSCPYNYATDELWAANAFIPFNTQVKVAFPEEYILGNVGAVLKTCSGPKLTMDWYKNNVYTPMSNIVNHMDGIFFESGLATVVYGCDTNFDVQFTPHKLVDFWNIILAAPNLDFFFYSHVKMAVGAEGIDTQKDTVNYWDALYYALAAFHIGRTNKTFFSFNRTNANIAPTGSIAPYYTDYDIDLGDPVDTYKKYGNTSVYYRAFDNGYVFLNTSITADVKNIILPVDCKQITHANHTSKLETLPDISTITVNKKRAAILLKSSFATVLPIIHNLKVISSVTQ